MFCRLVPITVATLISGFTNIALANNLFPPLPDDRGNYNSIQRINSAGEEINGVKGEHRNWQVITTGLNCRKNPGENNVIIRKFAQDDIIQAASFGRGGADEVIVIQRDNKGLPWLRVNLNPGQCFVRANSRFIKPVSQE